MNFIEELRWRGMLQDFTPGVEEFLLNNPTAGYLGVDPTGDSMHIGNLVPVMIMVHFQRAGHTPIALVGGATGMVGDPSGKDKERNLLSEEEIQHNVAGMRAQLAHFLDFNTAVNPAKLVNNYDWFKDMGFLEFLRDVGKHITISYMMSKDSVKKRMASEQGISYTEFAYQLLQGYDYVYLYQNHGVRIQVGGSDQWGNITTGTELIRRKLGHETEAFAVTCPLLTREDGSKFGKTADGDSVWLDPKKTTPYQFFQYWMNVSDEDAKKYIRIFTVKTREEIEALEAAHAENPGLRSLHRALAEDVTARVHGEKGLASAINLTDFHFGRQSGEEALAKLSIEDWLEVSNGPDKKSLSKSDLENGIGILDLLVQVGITQSKGEAKRAIENDKSVSLNARKVEAADFQVTTSDLFFGRFFQLQRGKKQKFIIEVSE